MDYKTLEKAFKVLGDKTRLEIIERIYQGERCGCDLLTHLDIRQPTLSHHLKVLSNAGFIKGIKTKNKILYTVKKNRIQKIVEAFNFLQTKNSNCEEKK